MWFIFDAKGNPITVCDHKPNVDDLAERNEVAIESNDSTFVFPKIVLQNGSISAITEKLCYYNNGLSQKTVDSNYTVAVGEVIFSSTPTEDELVATFSDYKKAVKQAKIDALNAKYDAEFEELSKSLGLASLANDTDLITELRSEYTDLKTAYAAELDAINNG